MDEPRRTSEPTYQDYLDAGFIPLLCNGYNPQYNPASLYDKAKEACQRGWTSPTYKPPSLQEIEAWEKKAGWIGWLVPKGWIAIDVEDADAIRHLRRLYKEKGIEPAIHRTNNGEHHIFRLSENSEISGSSEVFTQSGLKVTYRVGGKNYLILAPTNGRNWEVWYMEHLPVLLSELFPYDRKNSDHVLNNLCWQIGRALREGNLSGYEDIDFGLIDLLIESGLSDAQIHAALHLVFLANYDERRTSEMIDRTRQKKQAGDPIVGAGSFMQKVKELGLKEVGRFARELQSVTGEAAGPKQETSKKPMALCAVSIAEMLTMEFPPRASILSPWLFTQGLAMVHSQRGVGKTHIGIGIAVAVSSGGSYLRWTASEPRGVALIDGEMPGIGMQDRFAHAIRSSTTEPVAPLKIITPDLQEAGMPDLSTEEGQAALEPHLSDVSLIILDNLSTLCRTGRENEGESWLPVQEWALRLRSRGYSIIFIHHDGKGGQQRGTSRKEDVLDAVLHLKRPGDYRPEEGARFEVHFEKSRGIYGDDVKPFEAMLTTNSLGVQEWVMKTLEDSLTERIAALLNEGVPQHEIPEMLGVAKGTVSKHKRKAQELGLLKGTA